MLKKVILIIFLIYCLPFQVFALDECRPKTLQNDQCIYYSYEKTYIGHVNFACSYYTNVISDSDTCDTVSGPKESLKDQDYYYYRLIKHVFRGGGVIYWDTFATDYYPSVDNLGIPGYYVLNGVPPYDCGTCALEENQANSECVDGQWSWIDQSTCQYKCNPPLDCTQTDIDNAITECGTEENISWVKGIVGDIEYQDCSWICKDALCDDAFEKLKDFCSVGVRNFDSKTCNGECVGCDDMERLAKSECEDKGGVYDFTCNINDSNYVDEKKSKYGFSCNNDLPGVIDPASPPDDTGGGIDPNNPDDPDDPNNPVPPDPNDPENQPESDPTLDPNDTPDAQNTDLLGTIKHDLDTTIDQNNTQIGQLSDIVSNTKIIADNQGILQDEIGHVADNVREGTDKINDSINGLEESNKEGFKSITDSINNQATDAQFSGVPEFDSSLPNDNDYTEYDDNTTLATDSASTYISENLIVDPDGSPIHAEVTATGNACIDGSISMHGSIIPISICFDRPWMLQGYAIMKILMIGLAYLQSAQLLNKAIVA